jgi:cytochrome c peroxidase
VKIRSWREAGVAAACCTLLASGCGGGEPSTQAVASDETGLSRLELIGKRIFFDTSLSDPPGQSCASCHDPLSAFSGNFGSTVGVPFAANGSTLGLRNTPTAMYAGFTPEFSVVTEGMRRVAKGGQFLDGRAASLEEQARAPFFAAGEMNLANEGELAARLAIAPYGPLLAEEFGSDLFGDAPRAVQSATRAIAAFERTARFAPFSSKFDNALGGAAVLSDLEKEGLRLFDDPLKGNCSQCHAFKAAPQAASDLLFTDFSYHNIGVPRNARIPANADPAFFDLGLCGPRRARVAEDSLCGAFKVPTLRNVDRKHAFMHNGVFTRLRDVVAFHATRDTSPARWYREGTRLDDLPGAFHANVDLTLAPFRPAATASEGLDEREIDAITAFLGALSDGFGPSRVPGSR